MPVIAERALLRPDRYRKKFGVEPTLDNINSLVGDIFQAMELTIRLGNFRPPPDISYEDFLRMQHEVNYYRTPDTDRRPKPDARYDRLDTVLRGLKEVAELVSPGYQGYYARGYIVEEMFHGNNQPLLYAATDIIDTIEEATGKNLKWFKPFIGYTRTEILEKVKTGKLKLTPEQLEFIEKPGFTSL